VIAIHDLQLWFETFLVWERSAQNVYCVFISVLTRVRLYTCLRECRRACGWCSFGGIEESTSYLDNVSAPQCYAPLFLVRRTIESVRIGSAARQRAKSVLRSPLHWCSILKTYYVSVASIGEKSRVLFGQRTRASAQNQ